MIFGSRVISSLTPSDFDFGCIGDKPRRRWGLNKYYRLPNRLEITWSENSSNRKPYPQISFFNKDIEFGSGFMIWQNIGFHHSNSTLPLTWTYYHTQISEWGQRDIMQFCRAFISPRCPSIMYLLELLCSPYTKNNYLSPLFSVICRL